MKEPINYKNLPKYCKNSYHRLRFVFYSQFFRMENASLGEARKEIKIRLRLIREYFLMTKDTLASIFQFYPGTDNLISRFIGI